MTSLQKPAAATAEDDSPPEPGAARSIIDDQRGKVSEQLDLDARILFGAWGTAWLVGFGLQWLAARGDVDSVVAGATFGGLMVLAGVVTAVHSARRSAGVRGPSARQGAMYGWSWSLSFAGIVGLSVGLSRLGADSEVVGIVMTVASALLVAALYMTGGAMWGDVTFFALGAWIAVVTAVAAVIAGEATPLVMALAGGGGMLAAAGRDAVLRRRRAPAATGSAA